MYKKIIFVFILMSACIQAPDLFASNKHQKEASSGEKKSHKNRPKKTDGIALQLKMIRNEVEALSSSTSQENIERLLEWIGQIQAKVVKLQKKAEEKLEKYTARLNDQETNEKVIAKAQEKIQSYQESIEAYEEILILIDDIRAEILEKNQTSS